MLRLVRHRNRAQIALIAPFAVIALISVMGIVVDVGVFRVIDSELENAADAAALAAAWYDPVCPTGDPNDVGDVAGVDPLDPAAPDPRCPEYAVLNSSEHFSAIAQEVGRSNLGLATALCGSAPVIQPPLPHPILVPNTRAVTVIIHCEAGYLAGRIFGKQSMTITHWATAALGENQGGNLSTYVPYVGAASPPLIVRLVAL